jgi:hypothetical protein
MYLFVVYNLIFLCRWRSRWRSVTFVLSAYIDGIQRLIFSDCFWVFVVLNINFFATSIMEHNITIVTGLMLQTL